MQNDNKSDLDLGLFFESLLLIKFRPQDQKNDENAEVLIFVSLFLLITYDVKMIYEVVALVPPLSAAFSRGQLRTCVFFKKIYLHFGGIICIIDIIANPVKLNLFRLINRTVQCESLSLVLKDKSHIYSQKLKPQ